MTNGNIAIEPWLSARDRPVSTTAPPLRAQLSAVVSVAGLPTESNTKSAPRPAVSSRTALAVSSDASSVCVAPNCTESASGIGRRSIAMICSQPAMLAPCTMLSPTPPTPITTTDAPGGTCAALVTAPTPVSTAQPSVASASNGTSCGTGMAPSSATTTESAKQAVPRNGDTSRSRACSRAAPEGRRLR